MKKQILTFAVIALIGAGVTMTGCKKPDETAPVITLTGASEETIDLGGTYTNEATANDDKDGDISANITKGGTVDVTKVGTYTLTYDVSDEAGNAATQVTKTVKVKSDKLAGTYSVSDVVTGSTPSTNNGTYAYTVTVAQSSTDYNKILLTGFAGVAGQTIYATIEGSTITIPSQALTGANPSTSVSGTGTYSGTTFKINNFNYTASNAYYGTGNATYTKQ